MPLDLDAGSFDAALSKSSELSRRWLAMPPIEITNLVRQIVKRAGKGKRLIIENGALAPDIVRSILEGRQPFGAETH